MTQEADVQIDVTSVDIQAAIQKDPRLALLIQNAALTRKVQELAQKLAVIEENQRKGAKKGG
jgi:hypothetical protein